MAKPMFVWIKVMPVLLVDHQTGLLSLVRDIDPDKFKNNVLALAPGEVLRSADYLNHQL